MGQMEIWRGLDREVRAAGNLCVYAEARSRHFVLLHYPTPTSVVEMLHGRSFEAQCAREPLLNSLLAEHQARPRPLWTALLATAFRPMLVRLARRIRGLDVDEADQRVLVAFVETLAELPPGPKPVMRLAFATRRRVLRPLKQEQTRSAASDAFAEQTHSSGEDPEREAMLDGLRVARRAATVSPAPREALRTYAARISDAAPVHVDAALRNCRMRDLVSLRALLTA